MEWCFITTVRCVTLVFNHQREFPPDYVYRDPERKPGHLPKYTKENIKMQLTG